MDEMMLGYFDGFDPDSPSPSENRTHSYKHGFANGRDDLKHKPRAPASKLREMADKARFADAAKEKPPTLESKPEGTNKVDGNPFSP